MSDFLFVVPSGEAVALEPFHFAIIGQTQFSGKSTLIKRLADWTVQQDYRVLIFDTKETEADYADFGSEVASASGRLRQFCSHRLIGEPLSITFPPLCLPSLPRRS
jgi:ABC-type phosphate/phosphonate transport system ATPase subunit